MSANFRPSVGGIERFVEILADGLAGRGHGVTVATCSAGEYAGDRFGVVRIPASDVLRERLNVPYPLPAPRACVRVLRRLVARADVVHVNDALYLTSVASLVVARRAGVPSVLTQHVGFVPQQRALLDGGQRAAIATLGRCSRLATRVASYNPAVAAWAKATWGLPEVRVLPPGVPEAREVDRDALRRELGLPADRFVALFVGRDVPKKGLDLLLAARDPAYDLLAVTDRSPVRAPEGVRIMPFVEPERLRELLCCVDAFVLPSEGEGFPLSLQEALVTGLPCVVAAGPGYGHYLRDGETMLVEREPVAIREALRRLVRDEPYRRELAARAREAGRREFGVERFVDEYEQLFREAIANGRRSPAGSA